jgi:hypothetical protein
MREMSALFVASKGVEHNTDIVRRKEKAAVFLLCIHWFANLLHYIPENIKI